MAFTRRQLIPRLGRALNDRKLCVARNHTFPGVRGQEAVDFYFGFHPPIVVQVCDRPTRALFTRLLKHKPPPRRTKADQWTARARTPPVVIALVGTAPTPAMSQWCLKKSVRWILIDWEQPIDDAVTAFADGVAEIYDALRNPRIRASSRGRAGGGSMNRKRPSMSEDSYLYLDQLFQDCRSLLSADSVSRFEDELAAAEEELNHQHHPASLLHLARATELLVTRLAAQWDAQSDRKLLTAIAARENELRGLTTKLWKIREASPSTLEQRKAEARKLARKLVEGIFGMVMEPNATAHRDEPPRPTIQSALSAIRQRWKEVEVVRDAFKNLEDEQVIDKVTELRNSIAHAPSMGDVEYDVSQVVTMIKKMQTLVGQLKAIQTAVAPLLPTRQSQVH